MDSPFYLLLIFAVVILDGISSRIIQPHSDAFPNVVEELLDLLEEKGSRTNDLGRSQQQLRSPRENLDFQSPKGLGQIAGVAVDPKGNAVIFHRGDRTWNSESFLEGDWGKLFQETSLGPIVEDTVLTLNPLTGSLKSSWGGHMFYLPHGLHIDPRGNVWLTDVAMHQVFKFQPGSENKRNPALVLGEAFSPGSDDDHFCQPTSVAVAHTGEIVVADGYCNSRIMVFDPSGNVINRIPQPGKFVALRVPHGLAILEHGDVCVADRENMRVICMSLREGLEEYGDGKRRPPLTLHQPDLGRVFAVAAHGNTLYAVNGPTSPMIPVRGFIMDPNSETIFANWEPTTGSFTQPHAMAISPNGTELYVTEIGPNRIWKFDLVADGQSERQRLWNI